MTEPTKEQREAASKICRSDGSPQAIEYIAQFLAARDAEKDAALASKESELRWLRGIIGDVHSKSSLRREVAQGRVEAWVREHDAEVLRPWREAVDKSLDAFYATSSAVNLRAYKDEELEDLIRTKTVASMARMKFKAILAMRALLSPAPKDAIVEKETP